MNQICSIKSSAHGGVIMILLALLFSFTGIISAAEQITDLFKDARLSDFKGHLVKEEVPLSEVFSLENGILSVKKEPRGWLETKTSWHNFVIRAEVRYPGGPEKVNSGIFLRINGEHYRGYSPRSVEVQMEPKSIGLLMSFYDMKMSGPENRFSINRKHWSGVRRTVERFTNPEIENFKNWQKIEILCCEDVVVVTINGKIVNWAEGIENISGRIGFQSEGGAVDYRHVKIEEIQ